ncbi:glycosyltransferase family 4 protein [Enterococcus hirae]
MDKICFVTSYAGNSGANHSLVGLCEHLSQKFEVTVIVPSEKGFLPEMLRQKKIAYKVIFSFPWTVKIGDKQKRGYHVKKWLKWMVNTFQEKRLSSFLKKKQINIVHINTFTTGIGSLAASENHCKVVWSAREMMDVDINNEWIDEEKAVATISKADKIICVSDAVRQHFSEKLPLSKMSVVYNGIEQPSQKFSEPFQDSDELIFLIAGRITPKKGQLEIIKAFNQFLKISNRKARLLIVGTTEDSAYRKKLEKAMAEDNFCESYKIIDYTDNLINLIGSVDVMIISSYFEAYGRVTAEGMLCGRLVLGNRSGGTIELLANQRGVFFDIALIDELVSIFIDITERPSDYQQIARNGQSFALKELNAKKYAEKISQCYQEIVNKE